MKLIDLDDWKEKNAAFLGYGLQFNLDMVTDTLDHMPTIDAIPIAWLEEQRKCVMNTIGAAIYSQIIEDWRKEND